MPIFVAFFPTKTRGSHTSQHTYTIDRSKENGTRRRFLRSSYPIARSTASCSPAARYTTDWGAVYDYGQNGVELKNNIKQYWWQSMVLLHENIVGIDSAIFMHPTIWKASGHVDAFNDPLIDNRDSKKRYRADVLIEDQIAKYDEENQQGSGQGSQEVRRGLRRGPVPQHQRPRPGAPGQARCPARTLHPRHERRTRPERAAPDYPRRGK